MSSRLDIARDEIMGIINTAWEASPTTLGKRLVFQDTPGDLPEDAEANNNDQVWGRVALLHTGGGQASLANHQGRRRWQRRGFLTVSVFTPAGTGLSLSDSIAMMLHDALEGVSTPSGVWFRNVRLNEIGRSGAWYQINVLADFNYDEVK